MFTIYSVSVTGRPGVNMKKFLYLHLIVLMVISISAVCAQQNESNDQGEPDNKMLFAYQRNFARGSLSTKIQVLQDAASQERTGMGKLYMQAIRFYLDNFSTLREDPTAVELVKLASRLAGEAQYAPAASELWQLFQQSGDIGIKPHESLIIIILGEIAAAGGGNHIHHLLFR